MTLREKDHINWSILFFVLLLVTKPNNDCIFPQGVYSIYPLFHDKDAVLIPQLSGEWEIEGMGLKVTFSQAGDNFYLIVDSSSGGYSTAEATFLHIGEDQFLDIFPNIRVSNETNFFVAHQFIAHSIYKIKRINDSLLLFPFNYQWFPEPIKKKELGLSYTWNNNRLLITAATNELQAFLKVHNTEKGLFDNPIIITRKQGNQERTERNNNKTYDEIFKADNNEGSLQKCEPVFPCIEGWLGGDGDLSVPLSSTTDLWIFSDTFVGDRKQQNRKGAGMVSSTVGISTCDQNNNWSIHYYWRNQYTGNPEPIFQSHTKRYIYWPNEAFMLKDTLYVILDKIGLREGPKPEGPFGFDLAGVTLAKIKNVRSALPTEWEIEYIPWSSVFDPNAFNASITVYDGYLYTFMGRDQQKVFLTRLSLNKLEQPEENIEYYSKEKKWKPGITPEDADILFKDLIGGSVRYHEDLKRWILVYGPNWLSNKIFMRTAPELTGPWTDAVTLYECPNVGPKDACYCGREHIQLYNPADKTMLITYDCNADDASARMDIYVPRVIRLPVK